MALRGNVMPDKYQDEIEEILKGIEETEPLPQPRRGQPRQPAPDDLPMPRLEPAAESPRSAPSSRRWQTFSPGRVALAGIAILLLGILLSTLLPLPNLLGLNLLVVVGLLTLVAAYLLFFIRPRSAANRGQYWRGRSIAPSGPSLMQRLKNWLKE